MLGAYIFTIVLELIGCLVGLIVASRWPKSNSQNCCYQCLCPGSEPQPAPASAGNHPILAGRSVPVSYGVIAFFPWVLVCTRPCVCPPRVEFLFPPVLWKSCNQFPLAFKARFSEDSSCCWTPRVESLI